MARSNGLLPASLFNSMNTPETEAALLVSSCTWGCGHDYAMLADSTHSKDIAHGNEGVVVLAEFARKLERERNEARKLLIELQKIIAG